MSHRDAILLGPLQGVVIHPAHVLLIVGVKLLPCPLLVPLDEVRVLYAVGGRAAAVQGVAGEGHVQVDFRTAAHRAE
jgi:hypothetical protein